MSKVYGFKDRTTAERLRNLAGVSEPNSRPQGARVIKGQGWILKTPVGGILGRVGDTCGIAECTVYKINYSSGNLQPRQVGGVDSVQPVYNIFASDVAGDVFITAKEVDGKLVVDAEDCG